MENTEMQEPQRNTEGKATHSARSNADFSSASSVKTSVKTSVPSVVSGFILFMMLILFACRQSEKEHANHLQQRDTMQSMTHEHHEHTDTLDGLEHLLQSPSHTIISSQETVKPKLGKTPVNISGVGYVTMDERRNNKVSARTFGRIEKLYVKYNYQHVTKGEKILELYSPQLLTMQEELLFLLKNDTGGKMIERARQKLHLLGGSEQQLSKIEKSGIADATLSVYSPYSGFVFFSDESPASQKQMMMSGSSPSAMQGMTGMSQPGNQQSESIAKSSGTQIREGDYVAEGQTLFMVNDFSEVWVLASFDANNQLISINTPVTINTELAPGKTFEGKINLIEPTFESGQKFIRARICIKNPEGLLKPNAYVTVTVNKEAEAVTIPLSSVLDLGKRKVAFVRIGITTEGSGIFEAREIKTGIVIDERIHVTEGLSENDEIAKDAGYLIDSESLLR